MAEKNDSDLQSGTSKEAKESTEKPSFFSTSRGKWTLGIGAAVVVAIAIVLALLLTGVIGSSPAVAEVNGEKIYEKELDQQLKSFRAQQGAAGQQQDPQLEQKLKAYFLNNLIQQKLVLQEAEKMNIKVSDKEVEVRLKEIESQLGPDKVNELLKRMNWTRSDLRDAVKKELVSQKVSEKAIGNIEVEDEEIKKYYEKNKKTFQDPEKVKIKIVDFTSQDKAEKMADAVEKGEDFDKAAKKYTEKTDIKSEELSEEQITSGFGAEVGKGAFQLKPGQSSKAIKSDKGVFVVKVETKKESVQRSFKDVKENVKGILISQKQQQEYGKWVNSLKKKAKIKIFDKELEGAMNVPSSGHP